MQNLRVEASTTSLKTSRKLFIALTTCTLSLTHMLAGCGDSNDSASSSVEANGQNEAAQERAKGYPVSLKNCGTEQTFEKAPERVVLMNGGSVAEVSTMIALGVTDAIVANAQNYGSSDVKGQADLINGLPKGDIRLNEMQDIPREAMVGLKPDFVGSVYAGGFDAKNGFATRDELAKLGAKTYVPESGCADGLTSPTKPQTIEDSYNLIRDYGKIFGVPEKAEEIVAHSQKKIAELTKGVPTDDKKNVMVVFTGMGTDDFSSIGGAGIWNDIIAKVGGQNPFDDGSGKMFQTVSKEKLASTPIDALVVVSYQTPDIQQVSDNILKQFPEWPATKNNNVTVLTDSMYLGPNNHIAVEAIGKALADGETCADSTCPIQ